MKSLPGFQDGRVAVEDCDLYYVRGGAGPPIVLLHGWPETWWTWHRVMPELARTHTVVAFDLPGLGASGIPADGYDAARAARRIHQGVTALGLGPVGLLSHDLGSLIAYPYAREFPGDVTRMIVSEALLNGFGQEDAYAESFHFGFNAAPSPVPETMLHDEDVDVYHGWIFSTALHPDRIDQQVFFDAYRPAERRSAGYAYYRASAANAAYNRAGAAVKLTLPVMAIGGVAEIGTGVAESYAEVACDVREVVAPDAGHFLTLENPGFLVECARLFFGHEGAAVPVPDLADSAS
jgi:pimeloyl-ACP methyl ester carboxylesterase